MIIASYQDALAYLNQFIDLEKKPADQFRPEMMSLARPAALLRRLGQPQHRFPSLHIAGTKGKGSTAALCAACLRAAGYRVGLFTSPHLQDVRERIRILTPSDAAGWIDQSAFTSHVAALAQAADPAEPLTWYEWMTVIGFQHFAAAEVDLAVVEVGLGGRLDATNLLTPRVSLISRISYDHTSLLGDTLSAIAAEKGGIIKTGVPLVIAPQPTAARETLLRLAHERRALLIEVGRDWVVRGETIPRAASQRLVVEVAPPESFIQPPAAFDLALLGAYQQANAALALAALALIQPGFPRLTPAAVAAGLAGVSWPGRLQLLHRGAGSPTLVADGAHNGESAACLRLALAEHYPYRRLYLILGIGRDKDIAAILQNLLPAAERVIVTASSHPRAANPADIIDRAGEGRGKMTAAADLAGALETVRALAGPEDLVCVTGSLFLVGELLNQWERLQSDFTNSRRQHLAPADDESSGGRR